LNELSTSYRTGASLPQGFATGPLAIARRFPAAVELPFKPLARAPIATEADLPYLSKFPDSELFNLQQLDGYAKSGRAGVEILDNLVALLPALDASHMATARELLPKEAESIERSAAERIPQLQLELRRIYAMWGLTTKAGLQLAESMWSTREGG
jgi:hypothetical protein